jgi:hypothetical protein
VPQPVQIAAQIGVIDELAGAYSSTWHGDIYSLIVHAPLHLFNYKKIYKLKSRANGLWHFCPIWALLSTP